MGGMTNQVRQHRARGWPTGFSLNDHWIQGEAQKANLRCEASGPSVCCCILKPRVCYCVMRMVRPTECQQHVHVGNRNQNPSSSIKLRTTCGSIGFANGICTTGKPLRNSMPGA